MCQLLAGFAHRRERRAQPPDSAITSASSGDHQITDIVGVVEVADRKGNLDRTIGVPALDPFATLDDRQRAVEVANDVFEFG